MPPSELYAPALRHLSTDLGNLCTRARLNKALHLDLRWLLRLTFAPIHAAAQVEKERKKKEQEEAKKEMKETRPSRRSQRSRQLRLQEDLADALAQGGGRLRAIPPLLHHLNRLAQEPTRPVPPPLPPLTEQVKQLSEPRKLRPVHPVHFDVDEEDEEDEDDADYEEYGVTLVSPPSQMRATGAIHRTTNGFGDMGAHQCDDEEDEDEETETETQATVTVPTKRRASVVSTHMHLQKRGCTVHTPADTCRLMLRPCSRLNLTSHRLLDLLLAPVLGH